MLVQYKGVSFLTDPHLSLRASPVRFAFAKRLVPPALTVKQLPKIDFVVISHSHYDHLDLTTVQRLGDEVIWYVPLGLKKWFVACGIKADKVIELDWWQSHQFSKRVKVTMAPSRHWSKRSLWDRNKSLWGTWAVNVHGFKTWFAGDTGYDLKIFKQIGRRFGAFDVAFIPIGAYGPRHFMLAHHVDPAGAIKIHQDVQAKRSIPIHWGTFQLSSEPFFEPPKVLKQELEKQGLTEDVFPVIKIGKTIVF